MMAQLERITAPDFNVNGKGPAIFRISPANAMPAGNSQRLRLQFHCPGLIGGITDQPFPYMI